MADGLLVAVASGLWRFGYRLRSTTLSGQQGGGRIYKALRLVNTSSPFREVLSSGGDFDIAAALLSRGHDYHCGSHDVPSAAEVGARFEVRVK